MDLSSSPPLVPQTELTSSPPLLPIDSSRDINAKSFNRKRQLSEYDSLSSDPYFSDDVSDGGQENYERPKRKRMVKAPWHELGRRKLGQGLKAPTTKKLGYRNVDSGIWMNSDMSDESIDSFAPLVELPRDSQADAHLLAFTRSVNENTIDTIIQRCIDESIDSIDLSGHDLDFLSCESLKPLHQFIRPSHQLLTHPPSEDEFVPLTPAIKLFLSRNRLSSLPRELFSLNHITVLSLHVNKLTILPPTIGRLTRLVELNIASNRITFLPWELLTLIVAGCRVVARPNPLQAPNTACEALRVQLDLARTMKRQTSSDQSASKDEVIYLASSVISYYDYDGLSCRAPSLQPQAGLAVPSLRSRLVDSNVIAHTQSPVPSLFELSLRAVQAHYDLEPDSWQHDQYSPNVKAGLKSAADGIQQGNTVCSTCGRHFIIARAEWMEFWFVGVPNRDLTADAILPFARKTCSWKCATPTSVGTWRQ